MTSRHRQATKFLAMGRVPPWDRTLMTDDCASTALEIQCKINAHDLEQINYVTKADFRSWVEEEVNQDS